jgi:ribosomal-protein-alanine N-acetyltransferase
MSMELRSARLALRPLAPTDRDALHRLWIDPDVRRFLWDDRVIDLPTVDDVIARSAELFATEGFGLYALEPPGEPTLLGVCGMYRFPDREPEVIYSLARDCWGRGYATEASRVVIADAFERLGFPSVLARTDTPNHASIRVMERLGMRFAGERVENGLPTVSYTLTRDAWEAARRAGGAS